MDPIVVSLLAFLGVTGLVGLVAYFVRSRDGGLASDRLDALVGRGSLRESQSDLLLKQALSEVDKKTFFDAMTPKFMSMDKVFEQADANIRPSALFAISV